MGALSGARAGDGAGGGRLRLRDGRNLGYAEFGDPHGNPVFYFHGVPGVRVVLVGTPDVYTGARIHLVTMDRPGCGVSSRKPGLTLLDWPDDIMQLAHALGFERFAIVAESGGGPFALGCAYRIPEVLTSVVVSSGAGPMHRPGSRHGMKALNRLALAALPNRGLARLALRALRLLFDRWPGFVMDDLLCSGSPRADAQLLALEEMRASNLKMLAYATRNGVDGLVDELAALLSPWGFDPEQISLPIRFWHGDADNTVPLHHARYLSERIPGSTLVVCPGEGHLVMARHLPEILDAVVTPSATAAAVA